MPKTPSLAGVSVRGCAKPKCASYGPLNRHHRGHQAMWLGVWADRRKEEPRWERFVQRYHSYHEADCVMICVRHHAEIHLLYDRLIEEDIRQTGKSLRQYSWREAEYLMAKLEWACDNWLTQVTPGLEPEVLQRFRNRRVRRRTKRRRH